MSFFRDTADQLREAFTAMPMQSRLITVLLLIAIATSFGFLVQGSSNEDMVYLLDSTVLTEKELIAANMAFGSAGLSGWDAPGNRIMVPRDSRADFLAAYSESSLISSSLQNHAEEALASMGAFDSGETRRVRMSIAKEKNVAMFLEQYPDVRAASVTFTMGKRRGIQREAPKSVAVMITPQGSSELPRRRMKEIQRYVASAFLTDVENVNVTDINSTGLASLDDEAPYLQQIRALEDLTRRKILRQFSGIPGVIVEVSAEIDPTLNTNTLELRVDAQPTTLKTNQRTISSSTQGPAVGGVPGTVSNAFGNRPVSLDENARKSTLTDKTKETEAVASKTQIQTQKAGLQLQRTTATIIIPTNHYYDAWVAEEKLKNPDPEAEDPIPTADDIERYRTEKNTAWQNIVKAILPPPDPGGDPNLVQIIDQPDVRQAVDMGPKMSDLALTWLAKSWQTIALVMLGLFALLVARSAAKSGTGSATAPAEFAEGFGLELPAPPTPEEEIEEEGDKMEITGSTLKGELLSLVEQNPEVAANVIRGWVGEAA